MKQTFVNSKQPALVLPRLCFLIAVTLTIVCTLAPFEFSIPHGDLGSRIKATLEIPASSGELFKLLGHMIAFFGVGMLVAAVYARPLGRGGLRWFWLMAALFCVGLEGTQLLDQSRHARVTDLLCNTMGLIAGATASIRWNRLRSTRVMLIGWANRHAVRFLAGLLILALAVWCMAGLPVLGLSKMDWNHNDHLVIANETDGSRPWRGEVRYIGIYDRALSARDVLFARDNLGKPRRIDDFTKLGLVAGYDFTRGPTNEIIPAGKLRGDALAMEIPAESNWSAQGNGVFLEKNVILSSRAPASELTDDIMASGAFSVEAWVQPSDKTQAGPARIVSLSDGAFKRNFTLGQEGSDVVFRVRNGINGSNGTKYAMQIKGAILDSLQHWVAIYDHGVSSIFRDGQRLGSVDLREPPLHLFLGTGTGGRLAASILLVMMFALPAYEVCMFLSKRWARHTVAVMATLCVGALPYIITCLVVGGPWRPHFLVSLGAALVIAYPLCFLYVGQA